MNSEVETRWGTKIRIEGHPEEVDAILSSIQRREFNLMARHERRLDENHSRHFSGEYVGTAIKRMRPKEAVDELIERDFFESPRSLSEIRLKIKNEFQAFVPNSSLHPTLQLFYKKGILSKIETDDGFKYQLKKGENSS